MNDKLKPARKLDKTAILQDAQRELAMPSRRLFGKRLLTLGGLSMLTCCSLIPGAIPVEPAVALTSSKRRRKRKARAASSVACGSCGVPA